MKRVVLNENGSSWTTVLMQNRCSAEEQRTKNRTKRNEMQWSSKYRYLFCFCEIVQSMIASESRLKMFVSLFGYALQNRPERRPVPNDVKQTNLGLNRQKSRTGFWIPNLETSKDTNKRFWTALLSPAELLRYKDALHNGRIQAKIKNQKSGFWGGNRNGKHSLLHDGTGHRSERWPSGCSWLFIERRRRVACGWGGGGTRKTFPPAPITILTDLDVFFRTSFHCICLRIL